MTLTLNVYFQAQRIAEYNARKEAKEAKKGKVIAKSNIILDIKPWDDETDLEAMEKSIRSITMDGLLWGTGKFVPVGEVNESNQTLLQINTRS